MDVLAAFFHADGNAGAVGCHPRNRIGSGRGANRRFFSVPIHPHERPMRAGHGQVSERASITEGNLHRANFRIDADSVMIGTAAPYICNRSTSKAIARSDPPETNTR